jgi:DNA-binding XRE family transcriptional regulator
MKSAVQVFDNVAIHERRYLERYKENVKKNAKIMAENLRSFRKYLFQNNKISNSGQLRKMADMIQVSSQILERIEKGYPNCTMDTINKIASFMNVPMNVLFEEDGIAKYFAAEAVNIAPDGSLSSKKVGSIKERIKHIILYDGDNGATLMLPQRKEIARPVNTSIQFTINNKHTFYIDILKSKETKKVFFVHSENLPELITAISPQRVSDIPAEITYMNNAGAFICLSTFRQHQIKMKYFDHPMVIKEYSIATPSELELALPA